MAISDLVKKIEKEFGKEAISGTQQDIKFLHSGSLLLDDALGGGWAKGRVIEVHGKESSGKSTALLHAAVETQKEGKCVAYIDSENALDLNYARDIGVDVDDPEKFILCQPGTAEEAMEIARMCCETPEIGLTGIDSIAGMVPIALLQGEAGDAKIGLLARLMSAQLSLLTAPLKRNENILFLVNQLRDKIGGFGFSAGGSTTPGGNAPKYYASQRVEFARIGSEKEGDVSVSNKTKITVRKNKVAPPFRTCQISLRFGVGFDKIQEIVEMAVDYKVCKKSGSWYSYGGQQLAQGLAQLRELLIADEILFNDIYENVLQKRKEAVV